MLSRDLSVDSFKWYVGPTLAEYIEGVEIDAGSRDSLASEPFYRCMMCIKIKGIESEW